MSLKTFIYSRIAAFGHAFRGWWHVLKTQHNAWIHSVFATIVIIIGLWVGLKPLDWAVIVLTIAMVFTAEFINTAIEAVVDLASPVHHPLAKVGKDVGAGAVLVAALAGVVIGLLIIGPPLWTRLVSLFTNS
jgi:diacylglycerol kinase (ATP)